MTKLVAICIFKLVVIFTLKLCPSLRHKYYVINVSNLWHDKGYVSIGHSFFFYKRPDFSFDYSDMGEGASISQWGVGMLFLETPFNIVWVGIFH